MRWKKIVCLAILLAFSVGLAKIGFAQTKAHHIVFAITSNDEADWRLAMGNIRNLLAGEPTDSTEIEVVAFGPGLNMVRKATVVASDIQALEAKHVRFVACENSMKMQHVILEDLVEGVQSVPSGILEVVTKQEQGWTYIKAGR
jgi:intracellular sulfur oxidation DsrE/DsrF family protein